MKKKTLLWILLIVIVAIGSYFVWNSQSKKTAQDKEVVKIGAVLPLTGEMASYAIQLKKGMDLAVELNNSNSSNTKIEVIYEDDKGEAKNAVSAYRKLVDQDNVQIIIGGMFSSSTFAMTPLAEKDKRVLLSPTASAIELTEAGDYFFRIYPSDSYDGIFLANFVNKQIKAKRVAIIYEQIASITAIVDKFKYIFETGGGEVVLISGYNTNVNDFRSILRSIKSKNPDLIFIPGNLNSMSSLLIQAKQLNLETKFLSISTFYDPKILELTKDASEGVMFSTPMFNINDTKSEEIQGFAKKYLNKYGVEADILGGYGFDVINITLKSLRNGNNSDSIKNSLYNISNFPGVTGNTTFDENGDVIKELKIMIVKNGKFEAFH